MTTSEVILQVIITRFNCQLVVLGNWYAWFQKPHANILIDIVTLLVSIYYRDQEPITCRDYTFLILPSTMCVWCVCMCMCVCIHISTAEVIHNVLDTSIHQWKYCLQIPAQKTENVVSHKTCKLQCHRNRGIDIRVFHLLCRQWLQLSLQWNDPHHWLVCPIPSIECGAGLRIILQ